MKRPGPGGEVPWRCAECGLAVRFRLTPKSFKDAIKGVEMTAEGPAFKAWVRAVPENGAANAALEKLAADWLGVPKSAVRLVSGAKSRVKTLAVDGDADALAAQLTGRFDALQG